MAAGVEAGEDAGGAENFGDGRRLHIVDFLENLFEDDGQVFAAADVESGGAGVTVDGGFALDFEGFPDLFEGGPVDELVFDFVNVGVTADLALAGVAVEVGDGLEAEGEFRVGMFGDGGFGCPSCVRISGHPAGLAFESRFFDYFFRALFQELRSGTEDR